MSSTRIEEALVAISIQLVLVGIGALVGVRLGRVRTSPPRLLAVVLPAAGLVVVLVGAASGRLVESVVGFLAGAGVLVLTMLAAARLPRASGTATAVLGGLLALHAAVIGFVLVGFSPQAAPRGQAPLWWLAAATGLVRDQHLGLSGAEAPNQSPLWVRLSEAAGPLLMLLTVVVGLAIAHVLRGRSRRERVLRGQP
ncbi:hypothetical protein [Plantactinospora sp. GCM10030261]|uniref:hypothetical protein n=1 Tax=Plantactinospora sp. GCM10030261 TaxID=3273420 RepID=UPI00362102DE